MESQVFGGGGSFFVVIFGFQVIGSPLESPKNIKFHPKNVFYIESQVSGGGESILGLFFDLKQQGVSQNPPKIKLSQKPCYKWNPRFSREGNRFLGLFLDLKQQGDAGKGRTPQGVPLTPQRGEQQSANQPGHIVSIKFGISAGTGIQFVHCSEALAMLAKPRRKYKINMPIGSISESRGSRIGSRVPTRTYTQLSP